MKKDNIKIRIIKSLKNRKIIKKVKQNNNPDVNDNLSHLSNEEKKKKLQKIENKIKQLKEIEKKLKTTIKERTTPKRSVDINNLQKYDNKQQNLESMFNLFVNQSLDTITNDTVISNKNNEEKVNLSDLYHNSNEDILYNLKSINSDLSEMYPMTSWSDSDIEKFKQLYYNFNEIKPLVNDAKEIVKQFSSAYKILKSVFNSVNSKKDESSIEKEVYK